MGIDRLRYFAAVVETRNLRRAAELVGISPPSMSKAISVLEAELDKKLIHPDGRGIGITDEGLDIYRLSAALLEEHRVFLQNIQKSNHGSSKVIRIATFEVFSSYFLASFLAASSIKEFDVLLLEMTPGKIEQAILSGTVSLGLTYLPSPDPALEYVEIGSFEMNIFGQRRWQHVPFEDWPFAVPTTELRIHSSQFDSLDMWPKTNLKRQVKYQFELLETALQTSRKGISVLHCPDFIARLHNADVAPEFALMPLKAPPGYKAPKPVTAYLVGRKGSVPREFERKLAKFMRSIK